DLGGQGFMSSPCYHPCCQCCYQRLRIPTSLGRGSNSVGGNSSDYFFQCLNSCSNPRHVATIDHNLHAKEGQVWMGVVPEFISLADAAEGAQSTL
ncbi:MAG TPA: hypothetical protein VNH41_04195, partial [Steroidobacteraceae bacterium]|nr:hypothetical protein [Steroidobacteraceae bacterium]